MSNPNPDSKTQQLKAQLQRIQDWIDNDFAEINLYLESANHELDHIKTELNQYNQNHEQTPPVN